MAQAVQNVTMPDRASATDTLTDSGKTSLDTPGTTAVNIEGMGQIGKAPERHMLGVICTQVAFMSDEDKNSSFRFLTATLCSLLISDKGSLRRPWKALRVSEGSAVWTEEREAARTEFSELGSAAQNDSQFRAREN